MSVRVCYAYWLEAFQTFEKYGLVHELQAEHDELYAGPHPDAVSMEDKDRLAELGWTPCEEFQCFRRNA